MTEQVEQHILKRYQLLQKIGCGAYGQVWKVRHKITKQIFALKKIFDAFQHSTDAQRTYRQIVFLKQFQHDNIIKLHNVIRAENDKDIYLVFQYMQIDLHSVIRENILKQKHKQYIIYQIAKALKYLHSTELIHRDLKPSNVLINSQCLVKLCDFGLIRSINKLPDQQQLILTQYVATRWYRAPEILLGSHTYTKGVDIWSFGCLMAQLIRGKPMFAGNSTLNQLQKVLEWTGIPDYNEIKSLGSDIGDLIIQNLRGIRQKNTTQWFPQIDQTALDLLQKMLEINPQKRITVNQILEHPYLKQFHNPIKQPDCQKLIKPYIDDNRKLTVKEYRLLIYKSINKLQFSKRDIQITEIRCELAKQQKTRKKNSFRHTVKQFLQQKGQQQQAPKKFLVPNKKQIHFLTPLKNSNIDKSTSVNKKNQGSKYKNLTQGRQIQFNNNSNKHKHNLFSVHASKKNSLKYTMYHSNDKKSCLDEEKKNLDEDQKKMKSIYCSEKKNQLVLKYLHKADKFT